MKTPGLFTLQTLATGGNLVAGFSALVLAAGGDFVRAAVLVGVAGVFDLLDGFIARRGDEGDSSFGENLDSLADIVSFGVAPAVALFFASLSGMGSVGVGVASLFALAGAIRLARFPLVKDARFFVGLPIPPAGVALAALSVVAPHPAIGVSSVVALCALMVSRIPIPTPGYVIGRLRSGESREGRPE